MEVSVVVEVITLVKVVVEIDDVDTVSIVVVLVVCFAVLVIVDVMTGRVVKSVDVMTTVVGDAVVTLVTVRPGGAGLLLHATVVVLEESDKQLQAEETCLRCALSIGFAHQFRGRPVRAAVLFDSSLFVKGEPVKQRKL